jgi:hypothetical protein
MTSLIYQSLFFGLAMAGIWLADIAIPIKIFLLGIAGSIHIAIQYQIIGAALHATETLALIDARLRVIQLEMERAKRSQPDLKPAASVVAAQIQEEVRAKEFDAKINPVATNNTLHVGAALAVSAVVAIAVVAAFRHGAA